MNNRFTPARLRWAATLLLLKPPKMAATEGTTTQFCGILNSTPPNIALTSTTAESPAHGGPPQIHLHAAEHRRNVATAKIVGRHLALHTSENRVVIEHALVSRRWHVGDSGLRRRQPAPQHQQARADQHQRPEVTPREIQQAQRVGQKQAAHADQDSAGELAVRVRRIHHLGQSRRNQDHRPVPPPVVHVNDVQVVQQEQYADPDHHQRRNDARNVSLESPILVWLHEFSIGRQRRRVPWKSANTPVLPATAPSRVARAAPDAR